MARAWPAVQRVATPHMTLGGHRPGARVFLALLGEPGAEGATRAPPASLCPARAPEVNAVPTSYILNAPRIDRAVAALPSRLEMPSISSIERSSE